MARARRKHLRSEVSMTAALTGPTGIPPTKPRTVPWTSANHMRTAYFRSQIAGSPDIFDLVRHFALLSGLHRDGEAHGPRSDRLVLHALAADLPLLAAVEVLHHA